MPLQSAWEDDAEPLRGLPGPSCRSLGAAATHAGRSRRAGHSTARFVRAVPSASIEVAPKKRAQCGRPRSASVRWSESKFTGSRRALVLMQVRVTALATVPCLSHAGRRGRVGRIQFVAVLARSAKAVGTPGGAAASDCSWAWPRPAHVLTGPGRATDGQPEQRVSYDYGPGSTVTERRGGLRRHGTITADSTPGRRPWSVRTTNLVSVEGFGPDRSVCFDVCDDGA